MKEVGAWHQYRKPKMQGKKIVRFQHSMWYRWMNYMNNPPAPDAVILQLRAGIANMRELCEQYETKASK